MNVFFQLHKGQYVENFISRTTHAGKSINTQLLFLLKKCLMSRVDSQNFIHSTYYLKLKDQVRLTLVYNKLQIFIPQNS